MQTGRANASTMPKTRPRPIILHFKMGTLCSSVAKGHDIEITVQSSRGTDAATIS